MILSGSDTSFAFLCFAFIATITFLVFIHSIFRFVYDMRSWTSMKRNFIDICDWFIFVPRLARRFYHEPHLIRLGCRTLWRQRSFSSRIILPIVLKKCIRFKVILIILFFFLLSVVMYQKLTFDPHEILGLPTTADATQIRKQYRKLSIQYHPDKNKAPDARAVYTKIRRAYKMLADPQAYEEELATQVGVGDISVGLPSFLLDPEYHKIAAPLLLGTLFIFPIALIWMLSGTGDNDAIFREVIDRLIWLQDKYCEFYHLMGEPRSAYLDTTKTDDISAEWSVIYDEFEVGHFFAQICNEHVARTLNRLPIVVLQIKTNRHYLAAFQQFFQLHLKKQDVLSTIYKMKERPKKQLVANLQASNKRISQILEMLQSGKIQADIITEDDFQQQQQQLPISSKKDLKEKKKTHRT